MYVCMLTHVFTYSLTHFTHFTHLLTYSLTLIGEC